MCVLLKNLKGNTHVRILNRLVHVSSERPCVTTNIVSVKFGANSKVLADMVMSVFASQKWDQIMTFVNLHEHVDRGSYVGYTAIYMYMSKIYFVD